MKRTLLLLALLLFSFTAAYAQRSGWEEVEKVFGRKGVAQGDMYKITFPRGDLSITVGEVPVDPGLALTSWIGFQKVGKQAMMMGDLALLENEVAPVMVKLVAGGVNVTALHNHLIGSTPFVMYLHFSGQGKPEKLAGAMRAALATSATPMGPTAAQELTAAPPDWSNVETTLGKKGQKKRNLLQLGFPRKETIRENGMVVPSYLGMANSINLQMVGDKAATTGDFVLIGSEVNPVVKTLVEHGITVTAVHSHMLFESPRLFFLHFWGYDEPEKLAVGLKAALDKINLAR